MTDTIWSPTTDRIENSALRAYLNWLAEREGRAFPDHDALWAWSIEDLDRFWLSVLDYYQVDLATRWTRVRTADPMPHTRWFPGARLNWAQHALRNGSDDATALLCVQEGALPVREVTFGALRRSVAAMAGWLRRAIGAAPGGRPRPARADLDGIVVDAATRTVTVAGRPVELTAREFDLLAFLRRPAPAGVQPRPAARTGVEQRTGMAGRGHRHRARAPPASQSRG